MCCLFSHACVCVYVVLQHRAYGINQNCCCFCVNLKGTIREGRHSKWSVGASERQASCASCAQLSLFSPLSRSPTSIVSNCGSLIPARIMFMCLIHSLVLLLTIYHKSTHTHTESAPRTSGQNRLLAPPLLASPLALLHKHHT